MSKQIRRKGKFAKNNIVERRMNAISAMTGAKINKEKKRKEICDKEKELDDENFICSGTRLVELKELGKNLKCIRCNHILSLQNIVKERRFGLTSVLYVSCKNCNVISSVPAGKFHTTEKNEIHSDVTTGIILGAVHAGIGCTALNKLLSCGDVPTISYSLFKRYEREIGPMIEETAKESCRLAAKEERQLVIEKMEELCEELSEEIRTEIYPQFDALRCAINQSSSDNMQENSRNIPIDNNPQQFDARLGEIVNIIVSYDMGWSKRGNGKSYDSLNGYGAIIGFLSGKVLDYATRNRKCKSCDMGVSKNDHDCRLNFKGSAKAMEPSVGADLVNNSGILQETRTNVKVVIGDEDSSTISAIRQNSGQKIFKISDTNHLRKHFLGELYALKPSFPEMRRKQTIPHLKKLFTYAVKQNKGKTDKIAAILRSIPHHIFGHHENCGTWCQRSKSNVCEGQKILLQNEELFVRLNLIFKKYANNAAKFSISGSSQSNESLNNIMAHKAHKNCCYSLSESADYRFASSVASKNNGDKYVLQVKQKLSITPGKNTAAYAEQQTTVRDRRIRRAKLPATKKHRNLLVLKREALRKKNENFEGVQYQSNCGIEMNTGNSNSLSQIKCTSHELPTIQLNEANCSFLYFDLETTGFANTADILQIAAKLNNDTFSVYINSSQPVDHNASQVTGLRNFNGNLFYRGKKVNSFPIKEALIQFLQFLNRSDKPCIFVAHNAKFDSSFLVRAIINNSMIESFSNIAGFSDTYVQFKKLFSNRTGKGAFKLENLAKDLLNINSTGNFHEATYDVDILEKLTSSFIPKLDLVKNCKLYKNIVTIKLMSPQLTPFKNVVSLTIFNKLAMAEISFEVLSKHYAEYGRDGIIQLLSKKHSDKPLVTKDKKVIQKIVDILAKT